MLDLLGPDTRVGQFVESLFEATERIERDESDFFPVIVSVAGAVYVAPFAGLIIETDGG